jgi:DNA polymerase-4
MMEIAPLVERASIDEMYLDFTGCEAMYDNDLPGYMKRLQTLVRKEFSLPCTIALSSNKLVSKIAANTVKPNGVVVVTPGSEAHFLAPLPIEVIPGVRPKTAVILGRRGVRLVSDLQRWSVEECVKLLGRHGEWLGNAARGCGSDVLVPDSDRKSISEERTFSRDITDRALLEHRLHDLAGSVSSRLRLSGMKARTVTLKLRWSTFETVTRRTTIPSTNYDPDIFRAAQEMLSTLVAAARPVRLLGIGVSNFTTDGEEEPELFEGDGKRQRLLDAADSIRKKFGDEIIRIGEV